MVQLPCFVLDITSSFLCVAKGHLTEAEIQIVPGGGGGGGGFFLACEDFERIFEN